MAGKNKKVCHINVFKIFIIRTKLILGCFSELCDIALGSVDCCKKEIWNYELEWKESDT